MKKKILFISTRDTEGGATQWFFNLANYLNKAGYEVAFVTAYQRRTDHFIINIPIIHKKKSIYKRGYNFIKRKIGIVEEKLQTKAEYAFFPGENELESYVSAEKIISKLPFNPDIIVSGLVFGFINSSVLLELKKQTGATIYQTTFDISIFTGGCHVLWNCDGYKKDCSNCPGLVNNKRLSTENFKIRKRNIKEGEFRVFLGPGWALHIAEESALYKDAKKVKVGTCIDVDFFTNKNRDIAKRIFNLPNSSKVIFTGSTDLVDKRKGLDYFIQVLDALWEDLSEPERECTYIVLAGNKTTEETSIISSRIKFKKHVIDFVTDYRLLSLLYQASDIFACTSLEDTGPMMVPEAMACGTPVVGFETGLLFDDTIVVNGYNGYRVKQGDVNEFSIGIKNILNLSEYNYMKMSERARESIIENLSVEYFLKTIANL